jgi:6-phosphogluconolactonase
MKKSHAAVYVQTNDGQQNEIVAFERDAEGRLSRVGSYATGGRGTNSPHLPSQGSVAITPDGRQLVVANAGSDELTLFAVEDEGLRRTDVVSSSGSMPTTVTIHGDLLYVANNGSAAIAGFRIDGGRLRALDGSTRKLSSADADPAQISFSPNGKTLVVTERGTNSISTFAVDEAGYAMASSTIASAGETPYGFCFAADGALVVTEAFGGALGKAAVSSYAVPEPGTLQPVSASVADTRSEVCWAVATKDGRFVYVTNFGDDTISSYRVADGGRLELAESVAAVTQAGQPGIRDEAISADGRFLYALDADAQRVHAWEIGDDGTLVEVGSVDGLPVTVAGLAAS